MVVDSGVGAKGSSRMALSGGKGLGPTGAKRLADLLKESPPPMLTELCLRCIYCDLQGFLQLEQEAQACRGVGIHPRSLRLLAQSRATAHPWAT